MKVLILGGTRFLGRHVAAACAARQHEVTVFHRGRHSRGAPPDGVESIHGDRMRDLPKLRGRCWDAVIDSSAYVPETVRASAEAFRDGAAQYVLISSVSAYADLTARGITEEAPLAQLSRQELEQAAGVDTSGDVSAAAYGSLYGGLKALCEATADELLPGRLLIVRAGLVVGPYDYTDRFTYWSVRMGRGGTVLAPGAPERYVQFIDARDLAEWLVSMIERGDVGTYNATGPAEMLTMGATLGACAEVGGGGAEIEWADDAFLVRNGVTPWTEMPLWLPQTNPRRVGLTTVNCDKAGNKGLRYRSTTETAGDVLQWYAREEFGRPLRAGLAAAREKALLSEWRQESLR